MPAEQGQGGLPRRAARGVQPARERRRRSLGRARELGIAPGDFAVGTVTRLHDSKGNSFLVDAARLVLDQTAPRQVLRRRRGAAARRRWSSRPRRSGSATGSSSPASRATSPRVVSAFDLSVFPSLWEGTPLTVFEALAMGKTDSRDRRRRPAWTCSRDGHDAVIVPKRDARGARGRHRPADGRSGGASPARRAARAISGQQYDIAAFVRKMERLYDLLHRVSRPTHRRGILEADLSFLAGRATA